MRLLRGGPDVPERLLQAHEDGNVVFFCGAGISLKAGLPDFKKLTTILFDTHQGSPTRVQSEALKAGRWDTALALLEGSDRGRRDAVRKTLAGALRPVSTLPAALATHSALLRLAMARDGHLRLVTTNFDRLFEAARHTVAVPSRVFQAPALPVPKNRWDGLVYLHGLLPEEEDVDALNDLILTSGDFGLAYLTERWAARFVAELMRGYSVCFVGYSIYDPVLRYMVDALAADRLFGESTREMFAFGATGDRNRSHVESEWEAKNVTPILYRADSTHSRLHDTLRTWAAVYADGQSGKEKIARDAARLRPSASTRQDHTVERALWAISEKCGFPAKGFADYSPSAPLEWLAEIDRARYGIADLHRFGVGHFEDIPPGRTLEFSLLRRPPPASRAPYMMVAGPCPQWAGWDDRMPHIADWLCQHLGDSRLLLWVFRSGGRLHPRFQEMVEKRLTQLAMWEASGRHDEIEQIRQRAIPTPALRALWEICLGGGLWCRSEDTGFIQWSQKFNSTGLTYGLQHELRRLLSPRIKLQESSIGKSSVRTSIDLVAENVSYMLRQDGGALLRSLATASNFDLFDQLLVEAMTLLELTGDATPNEDPSLWHFPSISDHTQNRGYQDWTALIELLREAWYELARADVAAAKRAVHSWWSRPYLEPPRVPWRPVGLSHAGVAA